MSKRTIELMEDMQVGCRDFGKYLGSLGEKKLLKEHSPKLKTMHFFNTDLLASLILSVKQRNECNYIGLKFLKAKGAYKLILAYSKNGEIVYAGLAGVVKKIPIRNLKERTK